MQQSVLPAGLGRTPPVKQVRWELPERGLLQTGRALLAEGGPQRLYHGFGYAMLRAGPVAAVIMPCFELILPWLERQADKMAV